MPNIPMMLPTRFHRLRHHVQPMIFLTILGTQANAANLWWDGTPGTANGVSNAGSGNWIGAANWDKGTGNGYQTWADENDAIIAGTSTLEINANVTANTLSVTGSVTLRALNATPAIPVITLTNGGTIATNATMNFGGNQTTAGVAVDVRLGGDINTSVIGTRGTLTLSAGSIISSDSTTTRHIYANVSIGNGPSGFVGTFGDATRTGTIAISGNLGSGGGGTRIFEIASGTIVEVAGNYNSQTGGANGSQGLRVQGGGTLRVNGMTTTQESGGNFGNFIVGTGTDATTLELIGNGVITSVANVAGTMVNNITIGSANSTFRVNSTFSGSATAGVQTMSGVISGTGNLVQQGSGTLALTNTNTHSGTTTVSGGTLALMSTGTTGTGAVTVQTGGTIFGTGLVRGSSFTAESGSTVHAGNGTAQGDHGTLTFTPASGSGSFDFQTGSSTVLGINPGGSSDLLNFNGLSNGTLLFNGSLQVTASSYVPMSAETFNLLDWSNLGTVTFAGHFSTLSTRFGNEDDASGFDLPDISGSGYMWDISQFITNGTISVVAVPEPGRALLVMLGLTSLALRRRRALKR